MIMDQFDRVTVYQGDALAILDTLPAGSVDAVLTDPPYSSGGVTMSARQTDPANKYQQSGTRRQYPPMLGDAKDQRSWTHWCMLWLAECWGVSRDGAPLMVFTDWRWLGIVPWDKRAARPQIGKFKQQCEYVLFAVKGRFVPCTRQCPPGLYSHQVRAMQKVHLTSKPVALMHDLLAITQSGGTVLDPFMGGGSVGVACRESGRGYIGIELSAEYFAISRDRIAQTSQAS